MNDETAESQIQDWVAQSKRGSEAAFGHLFEAHYTMIYQFCYRFTLNAHIAQDLAQITFIKAARSIHTYRNHSSFKNWLYRIASNSAKDWLRKHRRETEALCELAESEPIQSHTPSLHEQVKSALSSLPPKHRQAVVLIYYEGLNHQEAATVMGCAEGTVSWYALRARQKLKRYFNHEA